MQLTCIEFLVVNPKMPRLDIHISLCLLCIINTEKLGYDVLSVLELRIILLKPELDTHVIILILSQAEAIPLQSISVAHPAVA